MYTKLRDVLVVTVQPLNGNRTSITFLQIDSSNDTPILFKLFDIKQFYYCVYF